MRLLRPTLFWHSPNLVYWQSRGSSLYMTCWEIVRFFCHCHWRYWRRHVRGEIRTSRRKVVNGRRRCRRGHAFWFGGGQSRTTSRPWVLATRMEIRWTSLANTAHALWNDFSSCARRRYLFGYRWGHGQGGRHFAILVADAFITEKRLSRWSCAINLFLDQSMHLL